MRLRFLRSFMAAGVGAGAGYLWARMSLTEAQQTEGPLPLVGMYATCGAAVGILLLRLVAVARAMYEDFFGDG